MEHDPLILRAIEICGTQPKLAELVGCRQQTISKLLNREISCSAEIAIGIHRATDGAVPASDLRPDLWRTPEAVPVDARESA